ncbi:potassium channel protein [Caenimonas koreensis DSM 17982]|uniref:Potassium channel protein n=1 Tax=Caenimonas koreensis DSM 17982 TaxID=1121255 RepID=A0A844AZN8_9BURK|nr:potassium channel protein [Caenimonas koreensis]MRD46303.1 potassium channel protein [Caenimonas koreensis DSM 17982]
MLEITPLKKIARSRHIRGLVTGGLLMALVHLVGTVGYHFIGRPVATWIDSFYMTFITVATIGYGETVDLSAHPFGRLFTVAIAIVGIGTWSYLFSTFVALLLESDLNSVLRKRHMQRQISDMKGHYIICGVGRVGSNVAAELLKTQREFVVIERDVGTIEQWLERSPDTLYLHDDGASDDALLRAGVMRAAGVFAVTGDDSHNLMIALSVKLLNPATRVVARLHDIRNSDKARKAGADEIVSPDFTGGMRIASAMVRPHVVNFMDQMLRADEGLRVEEVTVPAHLPARSLGALLPRSRRYMLMATHEKGEWVFNPGDDHVVQPGSALILMTTPQGRQDVQALIGA